MKTNNKHTPGPWKVEVHNGILEIWSDKEYISIIPPSIVAKREQNAALIATAPELYEMLDKINAAFYTRTSRKEWLELMGQTKPLLQKARGE